MRALSKQLKTFLIFATAAVLLTTCAVKAPTSSEELQEQVFANFILPSTWQSTAFSSADSTITSNWLSDFNDPQLDSLVQEALIYNYDLKISCIRIDQAMGYVEMAKAALRPAFSILGRQNTKLGGDLGGGLNGAILSASWEIDLWGKLRNARNAEEANLLALESEVSFAHLSLAALLAKSYYLATEIHLETELAKEMIRISEMMVDVATKRFEIGIGTEIDLVVSEANLNNLKDGLLQLELAYANQLRAMEILLGRYPAAEIQINEELIEMSNAIPAGIPFQILERRPDVLAALQRFNSAFYRVGEAKAARLPRLSLTGGFGAITSQVVTLRPEFSNPIRSIGGELFAPIYQGGALKANVEIRNSQQKEAAEIYGRTVLNAIGDVENALDAVETVDGREQFLVNAVASNEKAFELEQQLFEVGKTDMRDVIRQQMDLYSTQINLLRIRSQKISQRIDLYLALGGNM
ncbi:efflux transporter, outer membrane factor (OMF) lipoprotein, NodT family [Algoriphagus locisalis]|uniref:Efflux transporter, outer membrane factor (OMF) lipoprotein, NodT family n=1 Tax=Algoriphagus locisalis TaxID=305507 RepID=A0A1I7ARB1_9BACT|nr:TolC family protein [Algoriphagus locisalis]SFT77468.1 efflux transporter, outer membrane factor (OMF) lipoprotein, NodT family [Algoriphagus locisalis]